jgi:glycosyltransferase involved in cell wall biosynthesis
MDHDASLSTTLRHHQKIESQRLSHVHLVGGDPSPGDVLNALDALVVPSRYESFGLTLAEGLWAGIPVIATRSGLARLTPGLVREVPIGATGLELSDALLADQRDAIGTRDRVDRARQFARERLTLDRFGREWTELLVRLARAGQGGHR